MAVTLSVNAISLGENLLPHRRIKSFHGQSGQMQWQHSQMQAIDFIARQVFRYYFLKDGRAVRIVVGHHANGESFLKAETGTEFPDALLDLPVFSPPTTGLPS